MGKISFKDIVDLAKAGYKPGDLRELLALSETADAGKQEEPQEVVPAITEPESTNPEPVVRTENKEPAEPEETVDYKKLYEQSQEDLKKAQAANIKKDNAPAQPVDPKKDLIEKVRSFM